MQETFFPSSFSIYFIKLSTTNYCTHTNINSITPHLPLKVVMGLIIVFVGYIYVVRWGPLWVGINHYIGIFLIVQKTCLNVIFYCYMANKLLVERIESGLLDLLL